ncbi:MAG: ATP-binding protein [Nitrospira sp.]|nr:ATP-binding protein [Nitrospira sp.]MBH0182113.1 ATP-binding protein [Nitrospira sp.]MBH0185834.1 ATP-binding protein [Nitrospira sp.]
MDIPRILDLPKLLSTKSYFLFGPRQTGKTFMIRRQFPKAKYYNLHETDTFLKFNQAPHRLRQELTGKDKLVIMDEIQKLPLLLDEIQVLIDDRQARFLLTGSSARALKRKGLNLLGGRARTKRLHPLCYRELAHEFDLVKALDRGLLPSLYFSDSPYEDLQAYVGTYLKEEIAAEAVVRNLPAFSRFLTVAALCNGQMLNYSKIASDAQVPKSTVQEYFHILRDTLLGDDLPAWRRTEKRKPLTTAKFYLFDVGIVRHLQRRRHLQEGSPEFGEAFEAYLHHELKTYCDYKGVPDLAYWRSTSDFEVDFILNDRTAIEVKAKTNVSDRDLRGLRALQEEGLLKHYLVVSLEAVPRRVGGIQILPWQEFLARLWQGDFS